MHTAPTRTLHRALTLAWLVLPLGACGSSPDSATSESTADALGGAVPAGTLLHTTSSLNLRSKPSVGADVLAVIPLGATVVSTSTRAVANWYNVTYEGKTGWASGSFLARGAGAGGGQAASCSSDAQCNDGGAGTGRVCSTNSHTCIAGCHSDDDCSGGSTCDRSGAPWVCRPPTPAGGGGGGGGGSTSGPLNVPYECQNDNGTGLGGATCQITSAAMVLRYWGAKGHGSGQNTFARNVLARYGDYHFAQSPAGVAQLFRDYGLFAKSTEQGTIAEMRAHLDAGRPLVVNGFFTHGHVVAFIGYDDTGFFVNDPNGEWQGIPYVSGSQSYPGSECPGTSGRGVHIPYRLLHSTNVICTEPGPCWEGASGVWYAVADANPF